MRKSGAHFPPSARPSRHNKYTRNFSLWLRVAGGRLLRRASLGRCQKGWQTQSVYGREWVSEMQTNTRRGGAVKNVPLRRIARATLITRTNTFLPSGDIKQKINRRECINTSLSARACLFPVCSLKLFLLALFSAFRPTNCEKFADFRRAAGERRPQSAQVPRHGFYSRRILRVERRQPLRWLHPGQLRGRRRRHTQLQTRTSWWVCHFTLWNIWYFYDSC